ncbi:hypothetical protein [Herbaspirillum sp. ST 5-3]|uniref:hypothetical protein n=1 Tax=Oxalobacteraceae TaxID=75682 RepID=UPI0010A2F06B|nr:hypothetical protein [Herbaspirillum sp. ST 5-3]
MKNNRRFALTATFSALLPIALLFISSARSGHLFALADWELVPINWLFMAAPHILVIGLALIHKPFRHGLAAPSLLFFCALLIAFQSWVWFFVPAREGGLTWVLYIPVWVIGLVVVYAYRLYQRHASNNHAAL